MSTDEMQSELAELRAQVAELRKMRQPRRRAKAEAAPEAAAEGAEAPGAEGEAPEAPESELKKHVDDLVELIQHEAREMPVITTLAVFVAGIIVGRLTR